MWFLLWYICRYQPISHFVQWFSLCDVYRYQPISHSYGSSVFIAVLSHVIWSPEKIQHNIIFFYRAIWENTAHVLSIRCSAKGSHLIHWTSAVFLHIAFKWTPFACRQYDRRWQEDVMRPRGQEEVARSPEGGHEPLQRLKSGWKTFVENAMWSINYDNQCDMAGQHVCGNLCAVEIISVWPWEASVFSWSLYLDDLERLLSSNSVYSDKLGDNGV